MVRNWSSLGLFLLKSKVMYLDSQSVFTADTRFYISKGYLSLVKSNRLSMNLSVIRKRLFMRLMASFLSPSLSVLFRFARHSFFCKSSYLQQTRFWFLDNFARGFPLPVQLNWFLHRNLKYLNYARLFQFNLFLSNFYKSPVTIFSNFIHTNALPSSLDANPRFLYFFRLAKMSQISTLLNHLFKSMLIFKYYRAISASIFLVSTSLPSALSFLFNTFLSAPTSLSLDSKRLVPNYYEKLFKSRNGPSDEKVFLSEYSAFVSNLKPKYIPHRLCGEMTPLFGLFLSVIGQLRLLIVMSAAFLAKFSVINLVSSPDIY